MGKIGLVVEGGGMKCAYSAGVLDAFLENDISFDCCIGVSAGSANLASYLAKQPGRNKRFYTTHITSPEYFGIKSYLKTRNLFGLDYIYGSLSNSGGGDPLDYETLKANKSEYYVVATDALTGEPAYFGKADMKQDDYSILKASSAIPAVSHPVNINGGFYYDGGISDAIPLDKAFSLGCDKVVVITSKNRDFVRKPQKFKLIYSITCRKYPKVIELISNRHINYNKNMKHIYDEEKTGKAFVFAPSEHITMSTFKVDAENGERLYDLGLSDYESLKDSLRRFMT